MRIARRRTDVDRCPRRVWCCGPENEGSFGTSILMTFRVIHCRWCKVPSRGRARTGRLRLGVGPSHKPFIEGIFGMSSSTSRRNTFVNIWRCLRSTRTKGSVSFKGKRLACTRHAVAAWEFEPASKCSPRRLRPDGLRLCGELADGAISWMCPLPYLARFAAPALQAGARGAGRETASAGRWHVMVSRLARTRRLCGRRRGSKRVTTLTYRTTHRCCWTLATPK